MRKNNFLILSTSVAPALHYCLTVVFLTCNMYTPRNPDYNRGKFNYYQTLKFCYHVQLRTSRHTKFRPGTLMLIYRVKGKAVPLKAWSRPECSRKLRFPDLMTTAQEGGKVVSLMHWPPLPTRKSSWYSFLSEAESTPGP